MFEKTGERIVSTYLSQLKKRTIQDVPTTEVMILPGKY
jgi:hypothetical protein